MQNGRAGASRTEADLDAFLRWNSGHLLENRTRGVYAEWLVHRALGVDPGEHRIEWAEVDVAIGEIEVVWLFWTGSIVNL